MYNWVVGGFAMDSNKRDLISSKINEILKPTSEKRVVKKLTKSEITPLLQQAAVGIQREVQEGIQRKITVKTVDEIKYITKAVTPHFETVSKSKIDAVEQTYPETIKSLFDVAFCIIDGSFGQKVRDIYMLESPQQLPFHVILTLMLVFISKSSQEILPEVFKYLKEDKQFKQTVAMLVGIDIQAIENWIFHVEDHPVLKKLSAYLAPLKVPDQKVFEKLFHNFMDHLANPSHVLIELLIREHVIDRAIDTTLMIRNPVDRSKSFEMLIEAFLKQGATERAMELWELVPSKHERFQAARQIIEKLITQRKIEEALKFSLELQEQEEHDKLLKEAALKIAEERLLGKALEVAGLIQDNDVRQYTHSSLVHILCGQHDFANARKIALAISEDDFKQDAVMEIVKNYLRRRNYDEAIRFINTLENQYEKRKPAQLLEAALKVRREDEKIHKLRDMFSMLKIPLRKVS